MSATSPRGKKQREWQQGVESDRLSFKMCSLVCVCVHICVCEHGCVTMSLLTQLPLNHKSASWLFPLYPLDSFSTSHHSNFRVTRASRFFPHPCFCLRIFPSPASFPSLSVPRTVTLESILLVHLFHGVCFFSCPFWRAYWSIAKRDFPHQSGKESETASGLPENHLRRQE